MKQHDFPRIKPICTGEVWEDEFTASVGSEGVLFTDTENNKHFFMTWEEIYRAGVEYRQTEETIARRAYA